VQTDVFVSRVEPQQDSVSVDGFFEFQGVIHALHQLIINTQQAAVDIPPSAQNSPPAPNPYARQPISTTGIIKALTYGPRVEIDGAVLDNGTIVHVPPPVGMQCGWRVTVLVPALHRLGEEQTDSDRLYGAHLAPLGDH
jgi:hypothetical protein